MLDKKDKNKEKDNEIEDNEEDFPEDKESNDKNSDMSGDGKAKTKPTKGYQAAVALGKFLNSQGVAVWQHPDFNIEQGYTGSGQEAVMQRSAKSFHNFGEALDIPILGQGEKGLDKIAAMLKTNKKKYGINEIKWKTDADHMDHIHVSFKGVEAKTRGRRHRRGRSYRAKVDPKPSNKAATTENISSSGDVEEKSKEAQMQGELMKALLPLFGQEAQEKAATGQGKVIVSSGGDGTLDDAPNKEQVLKYYA